MKYDMKPIKNNLETQTDVYQTFDYVAKTLLSPWNKKVEFNVHCKLTNISSQTKYEIENDTFNLFFNFWRDECSREMKQSDSNLKEKRKQSN